MYSLNYAHDLVYIVCASGTSCLSFASTSKYLSPSHVTNLSIWVCFYSSSSVSMSFSNGLFSSSALTLLLSYVTGSVKRIQVETISLAVSSWIVSRFRSDLQTDHLQAFYMIYSKRRQAASSMACILFKLLGFFWLSYISVDRNLLAVCYCMMALVLKSCSKQRDRARSDSMK